ncbi:MAG: FAD binding domain-containing protein [Pirellulales bacterium]
MRDYLLVFINGRRHLVRGADCWLTLSDFLRGRLGLVGTKIVCSEGDCGSCTVLVGQPAGEHLQYRSIDSCIALMFQLDGRHIVTVEGLGGSEELTPVQQSLVGCHASQCGFCTPGFVMSMTGLLEESRQLDEEDWPQGLTGNLCRCTGYVSIFEAGKQLGDLQVQSLNDRYPPETMLNELAAESQAPFGIETEIYGQPGRLFGPTRLSDALEFLKRNLSAKVVAGATDVGVQINKGIIAPSVVLDLNRIEGLGDAGIEHGADGPTLIAGARATWSQIETICREEVPELARIVSVFGSPQIRHMGTIGGNIINASPIADSLPFLLVMEAELELCSARGKRVVPITDFYLAYKQFDLRPGELLARIRVPLLSATQHLRLYKVSRRRDLDISTFTAAILMQLQDNRVVDIRFALGAVGPTVVRARKTEAFLKGKLFDEATMRAAANIAASEISPVSDVRGAADYRYQLTRNVLMKFYHQQQVSEAHEIIHV